MFKAETQIAKVDPAEIQRISRFFMRLELVANAKGEFDVTEHFSKTDPDYNYMMIFMKNGKFDYKNFIADSINQIGTGFARVINGYEELVEKYCDANSLVLEPKDSDTLLIKAKFCKEFKTLNEYIDEMRYQDNKKFIVIGASGDEVAHEGFVNKNNYPIRVYERLQNIPPTPTVPYQSSTNN